MKPGAVVGNSNGMTMTAAELQSAGYVYVYDNRTGDRSVVNRNMLEQQLGKRREDGTYAFTTTKPEFERQYGGLKCLLHMQKRHRREWATIDGERIDEERIRERARQDNLAEAIRLLAERDSESSNKGTKNAQK